MKRKIYGWLRTRRKTNGEVWISNYRRMPENRRAMIILMDGEVGNKRRGIQNTKYFMALKEDLRGKELGVEQN